MELDRNWTEIGYKSDGNMMEIGSKSDVKMNRSWMDNVRT